MEIKKAEQEIQSFNTGAEREMKVDKGRYDLLPQSAWDLYALAEPLIKGRSTKPEHLYHSIGKMLKFDDMFSLYLVDVAVKSFHLVANAEEAAGSGLLPMQALAIHFEQGGRNRGDRNWENGIPLSSFISSGLRHFEQLAAGRTDEPHHRAFCWNTVAAVQTMRWINEGRLPMSLVDLPVPPQDLERIRERIEDAIH